MHRFLQDSLDEINIKNNLLGKSLTWTRKDQIDSYEQKNVRQKETQKKELLNTRHTEEKRENVQKQWRRKEHVSKMLNTQKR